MYPWNCKIEKKGVVCFCPERRTNDLELNDGETVSGRWEEIMFPILGVLMSAQSSAPLLLSPAHNRSLTKTWNGCSPPRHILRIPFVSFLRGNMLRRARYRTLGLGLTGSRENAIGVVNMCVPPCQRMKEGLHGQCHFYFPGCRLLSAAVRLLPHACRPAG